MTGIAALPKKLQNFDCPARFIQKPKSTLPSGCVGMSASGPGKLTGPGHRLEGGRKPVLAEAKVL